jgi:hypothetical protein
MKWTGSVRINIQGIKEAIIKDTIVEQIFYRNSSVYIGTGISATELVAGETYGSNIGEILIEACKKRTSYLKSYYFITFKLMEGDKLL